MVGSGKGLSMNADSRIRSLWLALLNLLLVMAAAGAMVAFILNRLA